MAGRILKPNSYPRTWARPRWWTPEAEWWEGLWASGPPGRPCGGQAGNKVWQKLHYICSCVTERSDICSGGSWGRGRGRITACSWQLTRPHSLVSLQSVLQLFGEQALLSNLEKKKKKQHREFLKRATPRAKVLAGERGLTLDRAVSRILSPVVDMATETERTSSSRFNKGANKSFAAAGRSWWQP